MKKINKNGSGAVCTKMVLGCTATIGASGMVANAAKTFMPMTSNPVMRVCQLVAYFAVDAAMSYAMVDALDRTVDESIESINSIVDASEQMKKAKKARAAAHG